MRLLVVYCHPHAGSFCHALLERVLAGLAVHGHEVDLLDLYAEGFDPVLREGEWLTGEHPTPATLTGPGHALLGTGEPPATSGILANEWWDRHQPRAT